MKMRQSNQDVVEVGKVVKNFSAMGSSGELFELSAFKGKKIILYFYPKDDTPGCTLEGQQFNHFLKEFSELNAHVFGVSRDSVTSHCKFIDKYGFKFELLSDQDEKLCQIFDVIKEKNMYGKKVLGIERSTFIINEEGVLVKEYRKIKADGHAEEILNDLKTL